MWAYGGPNLNGIKELVHKEGTKVQAVLDDSALNAAIRNGIVEVVGFLTDPENVDRMLSFALRGEVPDTKLPAKTTRSAVTVLLAPNIIKHLLDCEIYKQTLVGFLDSEYCKDPHNCGHYFRIIESLLRFTKGDFLSEIPNLRPFVIENMNCIAIRELFTLICTNFSSQFGVDTELFTEVTSKINKTNGLFTLKAIIEIIKTVPSTLQYLFDKDVISNLLTVASDHEIGPLVQNLAFELVEEILASEESDPEIEKVIEEAQSKFDFSAAKNDSVKAAALRIFTTSDKDLLLRILDPKPFTFLNKFIIRSYDAMSTEKLEEFLKENEVIPRLMDQISSSKTNYHLTDLANVIFKKRIDCGEQWDQFFNEQVNKKIHDRDMKYGGVNTEDLHSESETSDDNDADSFDDECIVTGNGSASINYNPNSMFNTLDSTSSSDDDSTEESNEEEDKIILNSSDDEEEVAEKPKEEEKATEEQKKEESEEEDSGEKKE